MELTKSDLALVEEMIDYIKKLHKKGIYYKIIELHNGTFSNIEIASLMLEEVQKTFPDTQLEIRIDQENENLQNLRFIFGQK